tara:strand:+ start:4499 stop:7087 length:2589 start_codon:yes stop_codon:yes gene_type:complete
MGVSYRSSSRGGSYKRRSFGDGGAAQRQKQTSTKIAALRDQSNKYQQVNEAYLGDVKQVHQLEAQNKAELKQHEDKKWNLRKNAKITRNQRDIEQLKGKAAEYGKAAQFWADWTPTLAKGLSDIAVETNLLAERRIKADLQARNLLPKTEASEIIKEGLEAAEEDALDSAEEIQLVYKNNQKLPLRYLGLSPKHSTAYQEIFAEKQIKNIEREVSELIHKHETDPEKPTPITSDNIDELRTVYIQQVLETYGWENSVAPNVVKLQKAMHSHFDSLKRQMIRTEDDRTSRDQFNTMYQLAKANNTWDQATVDSLARRWKFIRKEDGTFPNTAEAYRGFLGEMAKDVNIPFERIEEILDLNTLPGGFIKKFPTIGKRDAGIREFLVSERAAAEKKVVTALKNKKDFEEAQETKRIIDLLSHTGEYAPNGSKANQAWDGTEGSRLKLYQWAKTQGYSKLANLIDSYSAYDEAKYKKGLQLQQVEQLFDSGNWEEALNMLENTPGFTDDDRKKAKAAYTEIFQSLAKSGTNEKSIDDQLEKRLKQALGKEYVNTSRDKIPSLEGTIQKGRVHLLERYQHYLNQVPPNNRTKQTYKSALEDAWKDVKETIDAKRDYAFIETGLESASGFANFPASEPRPDEETWATRANIRLVEKNKAAWETDKILTMEAKQRIAEDIEAGLPVRVPLWMQEWSKRNGVPLSTMINNQLALEDVTKGGTKVKFSQQIQVTPADYALAGVPPGYLNVANRIKYAQSTDEIQRLSNYSVTGRRPENVDPVVNNVISNQLVPLIESRMNNKAGARTLATVQAMTPEYDIMSSIQFLDRSQSTFRLSDPGATGLLLRSFIANPELGLSYNAYNGFFVFEDY